jgi:hypothetical protein
LEEKDKETQRLRNIDLAEKEDLQKTVKVLTDKMNRSGLDEDRSETPLRQRETVVQNTPRVVSTLGIMVSDDSTPVPVPQLSVGPVEVWKHKLRKSLEGSSRNVKLTLTNWELWKRGTLVHLQSCGVKDWLLGRTSPKNEEENLFDVANENIIHNFLLGQLSEKIALLVIRCETAREVWKKLTDKFEIHSQSNQTRLNTMWMCLVMKPKQRMAAYIEDLEHIHEMLRGVGMEKDDEELTNKLMSGLGEEWEGMKETFYGSVVPGTYDQQCSLLLAAEARRETISGGRKFTPEINHTEGGRGRGMQTDFQTWQQQQKFGYQPRYQRGYQHGYNPEINYTQGGGRGRGGRGV